MNERATCVRLPYHVIFWCVRVTLWRIGMRWENGRNGAMKKATMIAVMMSH